MFSYEECMFKRLLLGKGAGHTSLTTQVPSQDSYKGRKERTKSIKLPFDLHTCYTMTLACSHHIHMHNDNLFKKLIYICYCSGIVLCVSHLFSN